MEKCVASFKKYKKQIIFGPIFKTIEVIFELLTPFLMKYMINVGIEYNITYNDPSKIIYPGLIIIGFCLLGFAATTVCQYFASVASQGVGTDLRNRIYEKVNELSLADIDNFGKGNLINLVTNDTNRIQLGVAMLMRLAFRAPILIIGSLVCSFIIDYRIGLIFLAIIPILSIILYFILRENSRNYLKVQKRLDSISLFTSDTIKGNRVIRSFNKEEDMVNDFEDLSFSYYKESKKSNLIAALINPITFFIVNSCILLVIYFGGNFTLNGELTTGDLVALISYLNQILLALIVVSNLVIVFTKSVTSIKRVDELLAKEPSIHNNPIHKDVNINVGEELLNFKNVDFSYAESSNLTLKNLNFVINKGEKIGIIGGTGSGKTSIIKLIERYYDVTNGEILYKGHNIKEYDINSLRNEISLVNQKSVLFQGTIKSNLLIGKENASDEEIIEALKDSEAYDFVRKYDDFIDHEVVEGGKNFSGGQKQRLSIARSLIKKSDILILDDSTSALDYLTDKRIRNNLEKYDDLTMIFISQRTSSIRNCDKIIVMENGQIEDIGTHDELLLRSLVYKEIYDSQTRSGT